MKVGRRPESPWGYEPRSERIGALALEAARLADQIRPLLAGVQGAVLAELLATWIAGHVDPTSEERLADQIRPLLAELLATWIAGHVDPTSEELTARLRAEFLAAHINGVEELVPVVAKGMGLPW
jgi:hypothetical protein